LKRPNKNLQTSRSGPCLLNPSLPCSVCPTGTDRCERARHRISYPHGRCANSFIPHKGYLMDGGFCMVCVNRNRIDIDKAADAAQTQKRQEKVWNR
jgi:hypothetical protein